MLGPDRHDEKSHAVFKTFRKKSPAVFEGRVMKGIPDSCRSRAWHLILDPKAELHPHRPKVQTLFDKAVPPVNDVILRDIPRTMPGVVMFQKQEVQDSLYRILRAYSNIDPDTGYYQGFAFSAALFLLYMNEARAFWAFYHLMQGKKRMVREIYKNGFQGLTKLNTVWAYLFQKKYPKVAATVEKIGVSPMIYTPSWFLTAFLNLDFPVAFRLRIMDRYITFGMRAIVSLALAIVGTVQDTLLQGKIEVVIPLLQNPGKVEELKDWRKLLKRWDKLFISEKEYRAVFTKLHVDYVP
jgi:hypothetical protein